MQAPFDRYRGVVLPEWVDYNGHMNVAYYLLAFDLATDLFLDELGLDSAHRERFGGTTFTAEIHLTYQRELEQGAPIRITTQLLGFDSKRVRYLHRMQHADEDFTAATAENLSLYVDLGRRKVAELRAETLERLAAALAAHEGLGRPEEAGRAISRPPLGGS